MTKFLNILSGMLLVLAFVLASCSATNKENIVSVEAPEKLDQDSEVDRQFSAEQLGRGNLIAFESRAKEKLVDFFNYLAIIADSEYDTAFRTHSVDLALDLFVDDSVRFSIGEELTTVGELTRNHFEGKYSKRKYEVQFVEVTHELKATGQEGYTGVLEFELSVITTDQNDFVEKRSLAIEAMKIQKSFGQDKRAVWEVLLGGQLLR
ncbi:MAG: hypothetical protein AAFN93_00980 [Bacteroidota bacterium]